MAVDKTKDIQVGGTLHSIATGNIIAHADEIMDEDYGKRQSVINQELSNRLTEELKGYLPLTGGTMNGNITFPNTLGILIQNKTNTDLLNAAGGTTTIDTVRDGLATKDEVDEAVNDINDSIQNVKDTYLPLSGGTMTGGITFESELDTNEYVDLGLPSGLLWAKYNIGATSEEEAGLYFQWGDTQGYTAEQVGDGEGLKEFNWADYKFSIEDSSSNFSKYNASDSKTVLDPEDDAVHVNMGGNWRMPTFDEYKELCLNTDIYLVPTEGEEIQGTAQDYGENVLISWATQAEGTFKGVKFYKKDSKQTYMFVPASGEANVGSVSSVGKSGSLWSSSLTSSDVMNGGLFGFDEGSSYVDSTNRCIGNPVRGVHPKSDASESNAGNIITVSGKTSTDLLNAAGGTINIDEKFNEELSGYLPLSGGTLTGNLYIQSDADTNSYNGVTFRKSNFTDINFGIEVVPLSILGGYESGAEELLVHSSSQFYLTLQSDGSEAGTGNPYGLRFRGSLGDIIWGPYGRGGSRISARGFSIAGKSNTDLLHAAGGTTVLKTIGGESLLGEGNIEITTNEDIEALFI